MAIATGTAIAISSMLAAASTAYQVGAADDARTQARNDAKDGQARQDKLMADAEERKKKEEGDLAARVAGRAARARRSADANSTYGGTLLTGPQGLTGPGPNSATKTLLGQ